MSNSKGRERQGPGQGAHEELTPVTVSATSGFLYAPVFGVLFDGLAYGMLLFLLSVGLSVTLGMMNFINLAHCSFAMLGGYVTVTLMNRYGWPFFATLPLRLHRRRRGQRGARAHCSSAVFIASSDLDQCLLTIGIVFISIAAAAYIFGTDQQPVQLPSYLRGSLAFMGIKLRGLSLVPDRGRRWRSPRLWSRHRIHPLWREGARGRRQSAHGARARHQRRPNCSRSRSRLAADLPASVARWLSRSSGSIPRSPSPT